MIEIISDLCRLLIRFIPVETVCHADLEDIKRTAKTLIEHHFPADASSPAISFAVFYEHRASIKLDRMDVINAIVDQIPQVNHSGIAMALQTWLACLVAVQQISVDSRPANRACWKKLIWTV